jgi:two-component system phosphate regulon sensor histidine kinase PhoR
MPAGRSNLQAIATPLSQELEGSVLMVFQDLTRIRRLETVRRDFISNVSHELRTPLASLKALTETLQEGALEDPPAARRFLSQMENEIDNLTQMVRELLELSRIESGRVPFQFKSCDPADLVSIPAERMRLQAERAGLNLQIEIGQDLPTVQADAERIEQVLVNLIHNAVKFTLPGGKITLGCHSRENDVVFFVRDSGVGIDSEDLARIFERFYKADRSRSGGGTGLGLSIARHVVESHNGIIWAESKLGEGSSFYFSLPKAQG